MSLPTPDAEFFGTASIVAGSILLLAYVARRGVDLAEGMAAFLAGVGLVGGTRMCGVAAGLLEFRARSGEPCRFGDDKVYVFVGGVTLLWISVAGATRVLRAPGKRAVQGPPALAGPRPPG